VPHGEVPNLIGDGHSGSWLTPLHGTNDTLTHPQEALSGVPLRLCIGHLGVWYLLMGKVPKAGRKLVDHSHDVRAALVLKTEFPSENFYTLFNLFIRDMPQHIGPRDHSAY
jgi:hypothetical protein